MADSFVQPHPAGVGFFILPPRARHFQIWRDPGPSRYDYELDDEGAPLTDPLTNQVIADPVVVPLPILSGYELHPRPCLDWTAPCDGPVTYWLMVAPSKDGPWVEDQRIKLEVVSERGYSVLKDGVTMDAFELRDAVAVFFSVRLAQLAAEDHVIARKPEWKKRFPMTVAYDFGEADLPLGAVGLAYGRGGPADLGWNLTEEDFKLSLQFAAKSREERDSITTAVRGLMQELDWFLEDMGCQNTTFGEMVQGYQDTAPVLYTLELAIGTTSYIWHQNRDESQWTMLPITWASGRDQLAEIFSPE